MKKEVGLWIDHRQAVLVTLTDSGEDMTRVYSNMERNGQSSENPWSPGLQQAENMQDRKNIRGLERYYDTVIKHIRDADAVYIFGPGEAKGELASRLERNSPGQHSVSIDTTDRLTDPQIAAKVRLYFSS